MSTSSSFVDVAKEIAEAAAADSSMLSTASSVPTASAAATEENKSPARPPIHVVAILDASGSMSSLTPGVIEGVNKALSNYRNDYVKGDAYTIVTFNENYAFLAKRRDLNAFKSITKKEYKAEGGTALYETGCIVLNMFTDPYTLFLIVTDGADMDSKKEYTQKRYNAAIEDATKRTGTHIIWLRQDDLSQKKLVEASGVKAKTMSSTDANDVMEDMEECENDEGSSSSSRPFDGKNVGGSISAALKAGMERLVVQSSSSSSDKK